MVGEAVPPGTYRGDGGSACYWERLSGFSGELGDIIANGGFIRFEIVTIAATDAGFNSRSCGTWTADLSAITAAPHTPFEEGTYLVGVDVSPGTWQTTTGSDGCYWERLAGFSGELHDIIANGGFATEVIVTIAASDAGFSSNGCGLWQRIGD